MTAKVEPQADQVEIKQNVNATAEVAKIEKRPRKPRRKIV